jgi:hypothetical protein
MERGNRRIIADDIANIAFGPINEALRRRRLSSDEEVTGAVQLVKDETKKTELKS